MNTTAKTTTRWVAAFAMAAGLGTAIVSGSAVASADNNGSSGAGTTPSGPVDGASSSSTFIDRLMQSVLSDIKMNNGHR